MIRHKRALSLGLLLVCLLPLRASAQQATQPGIVVTPALIEASVSAAIPETTAHITVRNTFTYPLELVAVLGGLRQEGTRLVPSGDPEPQLANATTFEPNSITVQPASEANITVHFRNSDELGPGGHYGSIVIRQTGNVMGQVGVQAAVSVGIFLTKEDGAIRSAEVTHIRTNGSAITLPSHVDVTFQNKGNVMVVPRASVDVAGGSSVVSRGIINTESIGVLPGETVTVRTTLRSVAHAWKPGVYSTAVSYRVDGSSEQKNTAISQIYIAPVTIGSLLLVVLTLLGVRMVTKKAHKKHTKRGASGDTTTPGHSQTKRVKKITIAEPDAGEKIPIRKA